MHDILDASEQPPKPGRLFSVLSFFVSILTIFLGPVLTVFLVFGDDQDQGILIVALCVLHLSGMSFMALSMRRKEPESTIRTIGDVLNITIFVGNMMFLLILLQL